MNQRLAAWREVLSRMLLKVDVEALSAEPFYADTSLRVLQGVRLGVGMFGPSISRRTRAIVCADNDDFYLIVNSEGPLTITRGETTVALEEGDGCLLSCSEEVSFARRSLGRLLCARFGRAPLEALVPDIGDCSGHVIRRSNDALRLFMAYVKDLDDSQDLGSAELRKLVVAHIFDLLAVALRLSREGTHAKSRAGLSGVRMRAVKKFIVGNLDSQNLTVAGVAAANGLSSRQVQRLFEAERTTFSEFIVLTRLQSAHAALTDPGQLQRSVSDIALASGFNDVSYFNRAFRRHYGASPSLVRQSASTPPQR